MHDQRVLAGAGFTAGLSCEVGDTCAFGAALALEPFGAPMPLSAGGVSACVTLNFKGDVTGSVDIATGALDVNLPLSVEVFLSPTISQPCPACLTADGVPDLGEPGTCSGGPRSGSPCRVGGLADRWWGAAAGTSSDCPPFGDPIAVFGLDVVATTGTALFGTSAESPNCRAVGFSQVKCLCDTCNDDTASLCRSNADCPPSGGSPGVCGGKRCLGGTNSGAPCSVGSECPQGACSAPGIATQPNQCDDGICTPTDDGGVCASGPVDNVCSGQPFRGCRSGTTTEDCERIYPDAGTCVAAARPCFTDPIVRSGTSDPSDPVLAGTFCLPPTAASAVNSVAGLPGPSAFTVPAEVLLQR